MILDEHGKPLASGLRPRNDDSCTECGAPQSQRAKTLGKSPSICMACGAYQGEEENDGKTKSH